MSLTPRDIVGKEYFVLTRYWGDECGEIECLRRILAFDQHDAIGQARAYAEAEGLYWYDITIPTVDELKGVEVRFRALWAERNRTKGGAA